MSLPFLKAFHLIDEVESTNDLARTMVAEDPPQAPFAIRALRQTRGRGRGANRWWSDEGSLTVSLVLDPAEHALSVAHESRLALVGALALVEALADYRPTGRLGLKWPNDVEIGRKKVAGFLTERVESSRGRYVILGMGVNILTDMSAAPEEVQALATSLVDVVPRGAKLEMDVVLAAFLEHFERHLEALGKDSPVLVDLWNAFDLLRDRPVVVEQGEQCVEGLGAGIDELGGLILHSGEFRHVVYGGTVVKF